MDLVIAATDSKEALERELREASSEVREVHPGLFACDLKWGAAGKLPYLVFARQVAPNAKAVSAPSVRTWARLVAGEVAGVLPDDELWSLHVHPFRAVQGGARMGARAWHSRTRTRQPGSTPSPRPVEPAPSGVGQHRCELIREAVVEELGKQRRRLARSLRAGDGRFSEGEALVQLVLVSADEGYLSIAAAPMPFEQQHVISCFAGGEVAIAEDERAPSRAFAKLVEAEARMGRRIAAGDTCVDLGASPGSWTYVAVKRGAKVTAVDRSELRDELQRHKSVRFHAGDAFRFEPPEPVDWLLCDVIASAERSAALLTRWLERGWCRHFVVTLKLRDSGDEKLLARLERELVKLTSELWILRLNASKKEVCAFGSIAEPPFG